jgi:hypothetical protein
MMTAKERYYNDPQFHGLVDLIYASISAGQFTATELRDAAMLAAILYEQHNTTPKWRIEMLGEKG